MNDPRALHSEAVQLTVEVASLIPSGELDRPTPCSEWDLTQLLDHMTVQNLGFAAAARGHGGCEENWATGARRNEPVAEYLASAEAVLVAVAEPGVLDRSFTLPELSRQHDFSGVQAVTMHTVDSLVHAWDVARSIGRHIAPGDELLRFTVAIGEQILDGEDRSRDGAHFRPRVPALHGSSSWERALALFGRSPNWAR